MQTNQMTTVDEMTARSQRSPLKNISIGKPNSEEEDSGSGTSTASSVSSSGGWWWREEERELPVKKRRMMSLDNGDRQQIIMDNGRMIVDGDDRISGGDLTAAGERKMRKMVKISTLLQRTAT
ncbi:hypothetical protein LINPERPRIM_LOCUS16534 [Linum perenne]